MKLYIKTKDTDLTKEEILKVLSLSSHFRENLEVLKIKSELVFKFEK